MLKSSVSSAASAAFYLLVFVVVAVVPTDQASSRRGQTTCSSSSLGAVVPPPGCTVLNTTATERRQVTYLDDAAPVDICDIEIYTTHASAGDAVRTAVWLPLQDWNGRFLGTGGGGFVAGYFDPALGAAAAAGFAAASTDAGVGLSGDPSGWAQDEQLVQNFVHLSVHEMTALGKQLTERFFGSAPHHSYWSGCSTGGRQGLSEAQRYPDDYDGILALAPAVHWDRIMPADLWPHVVQQQAGGFASACALDAIGNASVAACDGLDGAVDGLVGRPLRCDFDARSVIGDSVCCGDGGGDSTTKITARDAEVWNLIKDGPRDAEGRRLWHGLLPGTPYRETASEAPFRDSDSWIRDFVLRQPRDNITASKVTYVEYGELFARSVAGFDALWATDQADLSAFRAAGGKMLTWHGLADQLIAVQGTLDYWDAVVAANTAAEGASAAPAPIDDFYRLFLAPGVGHCGGGAGPAPSIPLSAMVKWVEESSPPATLPARGNGQSRELCLHPKQLAYSGSGNVADAASWGCVGDHSI